MPNQMIPATQQSALSRGQPVGNTYYEVLVRAIEIDYENITRFGIALTHGALVSDLLFAQPVCVGSADLPRQMAGNGAGNQLVP